MVELVEETSDERIGLKFKDILSVCSVSKKHEEDCTDLELVYKPGKSGIRIDPKNLLNFLDSFQGKQVAMEVIPICVLEQCIKECVESGRGRHASPEEVEISTNSHSRYLDIGKDWGIRAHLKCVIEVYQI